MGVTEDGDHESLVCVVPGCEWDAARGTAGGAPEPKCGGWTCPREGAFAWVTGSDPEDLESYAEHVRIVTTR